MQMAHGKSLCRHCQRITSSHVEAVPSQNVSFDAAEAAQMSEWMIALSDWLAERGARRAQSVVSKRRRRRRRDDIVPLAKDGVWVVPPSARPKGWESLGLKEGVTHGRVRK